MQQAASQHLGGAASSSEKRTLVLPLAEGCADGCPLPMADGSADIVPAGGNVYQSLPPGAPGFTLHKTGLSPAALELNKASRAHTDNNYGVSF